jgi:hypothetical protein
MRDLLAEVIDQSLSEVTHEEKHVMGWQGEHIQQI